MYRIRTFHEVEVETVHEERYDWSRKLSHSHEYLIQGLVSRELVCIHLSAPETLSAKTYVPVTYMVTYEILDKTACCSDVIVLICSGNILHKGIEQRNHPSVDLRALRHRNSLCRRIESVDIRIEGEE